MNRDPSAVPLRFLNQPGQLSGFRSALATAERIAIDTEVPISGPQAQRMRVMSVAVRMSDGTELAFVVDARDLDPTLLAPMLDGVIADAWNANFDARVIDEAVWNSKDTTYGLTWWDAQIADALIHQGRSGVTWYHGLAWATDHYLNISADGKGTTQLSYTAFDDLSPAQIAYAAADAVETLWVGDAIRSEIKSAGLETICEIEMRARPFLDQMERSGLPFDWEGWQTELGRIETQNRKVVGQLADQTGGGQGTLFDDVVEPSWNPNSDRQVKAALNRWSESRVLAWSKLRNGEPRLLAESDSVTATVLKEIGGELCQTLLEYRNQVKILSTYGESIHEHLHEDGRLRPRYLQVVGTSTGRLASRNPNAQNFAPRMKPYFRPRVLERVFVHADLSQAELRFLAQVANDTPLRNAFERGDDVHVSTAASMFNFDPRTLEADDLQRFKHLRQLAKALNFGIAYGTGAAALARSLSAAGSTTTIDEAAQLLAQYRNTYPGTAAWAEARIAEIQALRENVAQIDWTLTMRLARGFPDVAAIRRDFRKTHSRWPTAKDLAELHPRRTERDPDRLLEEITWLLTYPAPVALMANGEPFTFSSRTLAGRRQQFNLHLDRLFLHAALEAVKSSSADLVAVRRQFAANHSLTLESAGHAVGEAELAAQFEDRALRRLYIETIRADVGRDTAIELLTAAAKERISAMVNAWRNAPIQGGVADVMLTAYADLHTRLRDYPGAVPVQTVHDSVVIECNRAEAPAIVREVREALEEASKRFCPDVVPKADVDIRTTLADSDIVVTSSSGA